jgi:hypothetical protein
VETTSAIQNVIITQVIYAVQVAIIMDMPVLRLVIITPAMYAPITIQATIIATFIAIIMQDMYAIRIAIIMDNTVLPLVIITAITIAVMTIAEVLLLQVQQQVPVL